MELIGAVVAVLIVYPLTTLALYKWDPYYRYNLGRWFKDK